MRGLFRELKCRNVYRVVATYAVVAFVTLQVAEELNARWIVTVAVQSTGAGFELRAGLLGPGRREGVVPAGGHRARRGPD